MVPLCHTGARALSQRLPCLPSDKAGDMRRTFPRERKTVNGNVRNAVIYSNRKSPSNFTQLLLIGHLLKQRIQEDGGAANGYRPRGDLTPL